MIFSTTYLFKQNFLSPFSDDILRHKSGVVDESSDVRTNCLAHLTGRWRWTVLSLLKRSRPKTLSRTADILISPD